MARRTKKPGWLKQAIGEISKLRQSMFGRFGGVLYGGFSGQGSAPYVLSSNKVNYELSRQLYHNTHDGYKLGAGFAKPVVNTLAGFMGVPHFRCKDEEAQEILDECICRWTSRMQRTHQLGLRDGDCFVMLVNLESSSPLYPDEDHRIDYLLIPPEQVVDIEVDPFLRNPISYTLKGKVTWDEGLREYTVTQIITAKDITIELEGDIPPELPLGLELGTTPNKWGFIPIVHFKNEPEESELYGRSELEPIEPYMKAYHDVMIHALQGSKMHSVPRLKFLLNNVEKFLENNFPEALQAFRQGQPANINLTGHELLIFQEGENAEFIEVRSSIGDADALLKFLFYCIVDTSEVPEFAFGVHTPSSHASVKEQMPLLIRRVARKREQVTESWQLLARMVLIMNSTANGKKFGSYDVEIEWDAVLERDEKEYAETINTLVNALSTALLNGLISLDAAVDLLQQYIVTMQEYASDDPELPGERERIIKSWIMRRRLEDAEGLKDQLEEIDKELEDQTQQGD